MPTYTDDVTEILITTDAFTADVAAILYEFLRVHTTASTGAVTAHATTHEALVVRTIELVPIAAALVESLEVDDELGATAIKLATVIEHFVAHDEVDSVATLLASVAVYLVLRARTEALQILGVNEVLEVLTENSAELRAYLELLEDLLVEDSVSAGGYLTVSVSEDVEVDSDASTVAQLLADIEAGLDVYVAFRVGDEVIHGWVLNTDTRAYSEYQNFPFNSFGSAFGKFYGLAEDGLYLLEGDTDDGAPIEAAIRTGLLDMGTHHLKDAKAAHLGYTSDGQMVLKVAALVDGQKQEWWYKITPSETGELRESRATLGRGIRSRYWQLELANIAGSDFEIDDVTLMYQILSRRVR